MEGALLRDRYPARAREGFMRFFQFVIGFNLLLGGVATEAGESARFTTNAPSSVELRDQYDAPQRLSFPATNVVVLTIADRKGAEEVDGWIAALKPLHAGRVEFRGLADVAGVPRLFHAKVRARFQETRKYPVMLDWSGNVCAEFGYQFGTANILIIDREGRIRARLSGTASPAAFVSARVALEAALSSANAKRSTRVILLGFSKAPGARRGLTQLRLGLPISALSAYE